MLLMKIKPHNMCSVKPAIWLDCRGGHFITSQSGGNVESMMLWLLASNELSKRCRMRAIALSLGYWAKQEHRTTYIPAEELAVTQAAFGSPTSSPVATVGCLSAQRALGDRYGPRLVR